MLVGGSIAFEPVILRNVYFRMARGRRRYSKRKAFERSCKRKFGRFEVCARGSSLTFCSVEDGYTTLHRPAYNNNHLETVAFC
uniref:FLYWCH-type domain-containing protein n=1 Tax=Haemonchus contortus TaxID=6289 RepID=A0A7I4Z0Q8_HAECO